MPPSQTGFGDHYTKMPDDIPEQQYLKVKDHPAQGEIVVETLSQPEGRPLPVSLYVTDMLGRKVYTGDLPGLETGHIRHITLRKGIYLVVLKRGNRILDKKRVMVY